MIAYNSIFHGLEHRALPREVPLEPRERLYIIRV